LAISGRDPPRLVKLFSVTDVTALVSNFGFADLALLFLAPQ